MRLALPFLLLAAPACAEMLRPPLDCDLGRTCFVQQYPDADPGPGVADFTGGPLSYDGHDGTDFRVADLEALDDAPPVIAPADGTVLRARDDVPGGAFPEGQDCGNGLVIDHGEGVTTQLCHLAPGLMVAPGDVVVAGQPLGRIGMTGATEFPHVEIVVRRDGEVVDPYIAGLWTEPPAYQPGGLLSVGFAPEVPDYADVQAGTADADRLAPTDALVIWALLFGGREGDVMEFAIDGPDGRMFDHSETLTRTQAQVYRAAGRRAPPEGWPAGGYAGTIHLIRDGTRIDAREVTIQVR
ncbi:M23 family metallopeptidase [Jannaschia aquimarina]|uniref:Peptidase family M23 n=1 Tax=Jannaschia aquimarina TaxID=935700 RepID=A0A0D1EIH2_9RHOB|nr:M23 family metallopeptidase [Jannaschia aquimarina]KIT17404.1 Peptidase family M23 [Jannaschia aquimarina]SNT24386.1 Peptidase family M23 [Jannaschia aquimarina]